MTTKLNIPTTEIGKSYWNKNGRYQAEYNKLYEALVPARGQAETLFGEVVRAASRLGYDYYNNGNCNACETREIEGEWVDCSYCGGSGTYFDEDEEECECPDCGGEGGYYDESEYEYELNPFYGNFIQLIREFFTDNMPEAVGITSEIVNTILSGDCCSFDETEERPYVLMMDAIIYIIKSKAAQLEEAMKCSPEIPEWYKSEQRG